MSSLARLWSDYTALQAAKSLLGWDQQVLMPAGGASARSAHSTRLAALAHQILASDEMGMAIERLKAEALPGSDAEAIVRVVARARRTATALGERLVVRKAKASAEAYETWKVAKPANDYAAMRPHYEEMFAIARESSAALATEDAAHPYDPLLDQYEEGATTAQTRRLFDSMKAATRELLAAIAEAPPVRDEVLARKFDDAKLLGFMRETVKQMGFDMERGRLDICRNAFCTNLSMDDVRMTTRPSDHFKGIVSSSLHELGHALYEQNQDPDLAHTPLRGGVSLGVHESQSRTWENIVGRSLGFWTYFLPLLQEAFPDLIGLTPEEMWRMMNRVQPTYVRVGSDELTYNAHIWTRFELEIDLLDETLSFADLPEAWREKYREYLGIVPETETDGCLQDVHWSRGSVGYFPTYSLGNLMSYQIWARLERDLPDWEESFAMGDFAGVLGWLTDRIYRQGQRYRPQELLQRVCGEPIQASAWESGIRAKMTAVYGL
jgi:carboxypeptidase Taq